MSKKKTPKYLQESVGKVQAQPITYKYFHHNPGFMQGWLGEDDDASVLVSIRFLQHDYQCFSSWNSAEMKEFWAFISKIHQFTWRNLYDQARKGAGKTGFALTYLSHDLYPKGNFIDSLDPSLSLFELRAGDEKRIHGFRDKAVFYLCWLDKNHDICPAK